MSATARRSYALSILTPDFSLPGLFTGAITMTAKGQILAQSVRSASHEGEAFSAALRFEDVETAIRAAAILRVISSPEISVEIVELEKLT